MWRRNRAGYLKMAEAPGNYTLHSWIPQFQAEDARDEGERARAVYFDGPMRVVEIAISS